MQLLFYTELELYNAWIVGAVKKALNNFLYFYLCEYYYYYFIPN